MCAPPPFQVIIIAMRRLAYTLLEIYSSKSTCILTPRFNQAFATAFISTRPSSPLPLSFPISLHPSSLPSSHP